MITNLLFRLANSQRLQEKSRLMGADNPISSRFIAGQTFEQALERIQEFIKHGQMVELQLVEAEPKTRKEVAARTQNYLDVVDKIDKNGINQVVDLLISPSQLGINRGSDGRKEALSNARSICQHATNLGISLTCGLGNNVDRAVAHDWAGELIQDFPNTGVTIYGKDIDSDQQCRQICQMSGVRVKLSEHQLYCSTKPAHRRTTSGELAFVKCMRILFASNVYPMIATHDPRMIAIGIYLAKKNGKKTDQFEFQLRQGMRPQEQQRIVDTGFQARVAVAFGNAWNSYLLKVLAVAPSEFRSYVRAVIGRKP